MQREGKPVTKVAVARRAGVSVVFLRSHPDLVQRIEEAEATRRSRPTPVVSAGEATKDQVISSLRRRIENLKCELASKDEIIREKQRQIDRLYGKLASRGG